VHHLRSSFSADTAFDIAVFLFSMICASPRITRCQGVASSGVRLLGASGLCRLPLSSHRIVCSEYNVISCERVNLVPGLAVVYRGSYLARDKVKLGVLSPHLKQWQRHNNQSDLRCHLWCKYLGFVAEVWGMVVSSYPREHATCFAKAHVVSKYATTEFQWALRGTLSR